MLKLTTPIMIDPREKFKPNWEGPWLVNKLFSKGATIFFDLKENEFLLLNLRRIYFRRKKSATDIAVANSVAELIFFIWWYNLIRVHLLWSNMHVNV